jgi:Fur family transcriptional regulator, peroxide stress response regulator
LEDTLVAGMTTRRKAVLEAVRASGGHVSASDIWERARAIEPRISFATVYNAVHYLSKAGLLIEIPFGDGATLYDARTDDHDHALCTKCGGIVDYDCGIATQAAMDTARKSGFLASEVRITVVGLCADCQSAQ